MKKWLSQYFRILIGFVFGFLIAILLVHGTELFGYAQADTATFAIIGIGTLIGIV